MEPPLHIKRHLMNVFYVEGRLHVKKHSTNADTSLLYLMNHPQLVSKNVSTNIGHQFFALLDKHLPKDHKLRRIFNCNPIKISYSCINNTKQIMDNYNKCILNSSKPINDTTNNTNTKDTKTFSCQQKITCPLGGNASRHHKSTRPLSHVRTTEPLRYTSDLQKITSRLDTETTPHRSNTKTQKLYQTQQTYLDP